MSAVFSECRMWRYALRRELGGGAGTVNFVMLNPSTADETRDDATIRRCSGFARQWGFGRLVVTNLFALRATRPLALREAPDPVGPQNDSYLVAAAEEAERIVVAWGMHGVLYSRAAAVRRLLEGSGSRRLEHLGLTAGGHPRHPLYLPATATLQPCVVHM